MTERLQAQLGDRFAGVWWSAGASLELNAGATRGVGPAVAEIASTAVAEVPIKTVEVRNDAGQLRAAQARALAVATRSGRDAGAGIDFSINGIAIDYAGPDPAFEAEVREAVGETVNVQFNPSGAPGTDSCYSRYNCRDTPGRGGLEILPSGCTSGFPAIAPNGDRGFVTARHCVGQDVRVSHAGADFGRTTILSQFASIDVAFVKWTLPWRDNAGAGWFHDAYTPFRRNYNVSTASYYAQGNTHCHVGSGTTYERCGTITHTNYSYTDSGIQYQDLYRYSACSKGGDSGGPTYSAGGTSAGIHSGGGRDDCPAADFSIAVYNWSIYQHLYGVRYLVG